MKSPNDWKGLYYFSRTGFSFNEGCGPLNFHASWNNLATMGRRLYVYVAIRVPWIGWCRWDNA